MNAHRAVFLDRDGTLIVDVGYPRDPDQVQLLPGCAEALKTFQDHGLAIVVVSNQSGIGRGLVTEKEAAAVHERFAGNLARHGIKLAGAYYCPHSPHDNCECRKPKIGLFLKAADELNLRLDISFMVGDKLSDVEAGVTAGCRSIWFQPDAKKFQGASMAHAVAANWREASQWILNALKAE